MLPRDGKSVAVDFAETYDVVFTDVARRVLEAVKQSAAERSAAVAAIKPPASEWPALPDDAIDITRLPVTGKDLFGRRERMKELDEVWKAKELNVLSLVAWGGVGKSTLVNKWLERMGADNYRGARRVFGWSFYSQGTSERVTSADRFIATALEWFGDEYPTAGSPWSKGERLAKLIAKERALLVLDGMEPLQSSQEFEKGHIKDPALFMMLRGLAKENPGLCVITTRENVTDLARFEAGVSEENLERITPEAGRAILRVRHVGGPDGDLEAATKAFGCHALAVNLLASYLRDIPQHPIAAAEDIPDLDIPVKKGRHARRVIAAFETRFGAGPEVGMLRVLGLFDRPASGPEIKAVLAAPPIAGLTSDLSKMDEVGRLAVVDKLRGLGLLATRSTHEPDEIDAHPLVREHFGECLEKDYPEAWRAGHERLYEYLTGDGCKKDLPDTAEEMAPLYAAVLHGCAAGRQQEAFEEVYRRRIQRGNEAYNTHKLGAIGAELGALAGLFDEPWRRSAAALSKAAQTFVLSEAGFDLRALGRLKEAVDPMLAGLEVVVEQQNWISAARYSTNLSELHLMLGRIEEAIETAKQGVGFADSSGDAFVQLYDRTTLADALHQAGRASEAAALFQEAERMQKERQPEYPVLCSVQGYRYRDLLLGRGEYQGVLEWATQTLEWMLKDPNAPLLTVAVERLSLGRALLLQVRVKGTDAYKKAWAYIDLAVDGLREAGQQDYVPRGLLARAELYVFTGDHADARTALDEALDIATRDPAGLMKLHVTDCRLGYARLALAEEKPEVARDELGKARALIEETGYHRRDEELAELEKRVEEPGDSGT
jgi:tetratricopeptide (TPR) repeat protein